MGVHGLWSLLDPIGRRISIESLEHTTLAIDVSIWLTQFVKAMRDDEGEPIRNAHLLGTLRRCLRLLFTGIRPIFVFDGGVPAAKARLIRQRQLKREQEADEATAVARSILQQRLKHLATHKPGGFDPGKQREQEEEENEEEDVDWEQPSSSSDGSSDEAPLDVDGDIDVNALCALPVTLRKEAVEAAQRRQRVAARSQFMPHAGDMANFSSAQLSTFLDGAAFRQRIENAQKHVDRESDLSQRIHSDAARRFFLLKDSDESGGYRPGGVRARMEHFLASNQQWLSKNANEETRVQPAKQSSRRQHAMPRRPRPADIDAYERGRLAEEAELERLADMTPDEAAAEGLIDVPGGATASCAPAIESGEKDIDNEFMTNTEFAQEDGRVAEQEAQAPEGGFIAELPCADEGGGFIAEDTQAEGSGFMSQTAQAKTARFRAESTTAEEADFTTESTRTEVRGLIDASITAEGVFVVTKDAHSDHNDVDLESTAANEGGFIAESTFDDHGGFVAQSNSGKSAGFEAEDPAREQADNTATSSKDDVGIADSPAVTGVKGCTVDESYVAAGEPVARNAERHVSQGMNGGEKISAAIVTHGQPDDEEEAAWEACDESEPDESADCQNDEVVLELECEDAAKLRSEIDSLFVPQPPTEISNASTKEIQENDNQIDRATSTIAAALKTADGMASWAGQAFRRALTESGMPEPSRAEDEDNGNQRVAEKDDAVNSEEQQQQEDESCQEAEKNIDEAQTDTLEQDMARHRDAAEQRGFYSVCPDFDEQMAFALAHSEECDMPGLRKTLESTKNEREREALAYVLDAVCELRAMKRGIPKECYAVCPDFEEQLEFARENAEDCDLEGLRESARESSDERERIAKEVIIRAVENEITTLNNERREKQRNAARMKQHMKQSDHVTSEMRSEVMELLQILGVPFLEAPMEAEAQCAYLESEGVVEGVVTDDSDAFVFGARRVYKNIFDERKFVIAYYASDAKLEHNLDKVDFTTLALLLGGDYCRKVKNVGIVNAMEVLAAFKKRDDALPTETLTRFRRWVEGDDSDANFDQKIAAYASTHGKSRTRFELPAGFPSKEAERAYLQPRVLDLAQLRKQLVTDRPMVCFDNDADEDPQLFRWVPPDFDRLRTWCRETLGWVDSKIDSELGHVIAKITDRASRQRTTRIDAFYETYHMNKRIATVNSDRLRSAINGEAAGRLRRNNRRERRNQAPSEDSSDVESDSPLVENSGHTDDQQPNVKSAVSSYPSRMRAAAKRAKRKLCELSDGHHDGKIDNE